MTSWCRCAISSGRRLTCPLSRPTWRSQCKVRPGRPALDEAGVVVSRAAVAAKEAEAGVAEVVAWGWAWAWAVGPMMQPRQEVPKRQAPKFHRAHTLHNPATHLTISLHIRQ